MSAKFDEEALRKKIREELEKEHTEKRTSFEKKLSDETVAAYEEDESYYLEVYIRRKLQDEVYSQYAEFIKCENHLNQVKWLTPFEMEEEFEFFPVEYSAWEKLKDRIFTKSRVKIPDSPAINNMIDDFRQEIETDAIERVSKYKKFLENVSQYKLNEHKKKIIEEERDRFYKSLKGYYKYRNHIGETKWMTAAEFEVQDEFTDRVYSKTEKSVRYIAAIITLTAVIASVIITYKSLTPGIQKGYVLIEIEDPKTRASLYINQNLAMGFTAGVPYPVDEGTHEIALLSPEFKTEPGFHKVEIAIDDTVVIKFKLIKVNGNSGVVRLNVPAVDAGVYVDGEFKGTVERSKILSLPVGDHSITIKKPDYIANPRLHTFSLNPGDTIDLSFRMIQLMSSAGRSEPVSSLNLGLIEINSNVSGAEIYLDGHKTGFSTDHVLQKIPLGQHILKVEKDGYKVYPEEQVVNLTQNERTARIDFLLTSLTRNITILVKPRSANIIINGVNMATGIYRGPVALGENEVSFNDIENYISPGKQNIVVTRDGPDRFEFAYINDLQFEIKPGSVISSASDVRVSTGYILSGINFKANATNGPDVILNPTINENVWNLGFAFQYRNPPGNDAIFIRFELPNDFVVSDDVKLKLWLYGTNNNYPLIIGGKSEYLLAMNNRIIFDNKTPRNNISQISANNFEEYSIKDFLKPGVNNLIISCTSNNTRFMHLWKIIIR